MREHHLEDRRVAGATPRCELGDQFLERQLLVGVGVERRLAQLAEKVSEVVALREVTADHQGVDEKADQRLDLVPRTAGDRATHHHVALATQAVQKGQETRQERHVEGRTALSGQGIQRFDQALRRLHPQPPAGLRSHRRPRAVARQVDHLGDTAQLLAPIVQLAFDFALGKPTPLPGRVIGVLDRQRRER